MIAAFASNLHRAQQVICTAARYNRRVALVGRSMIAYMDLARKLGYVDATDDMFIPQNEIEATPPNRLVVLTTGSQGEPFSGLVLMSKGEHRQIRLGQKDLVIISATAIPGNEKLVSRTVDLLFSCGAEVVYEREQHIHVSGHASREELKMMLSMVSPVCFAPIHGEYRHQVRHAQLARELGIAQKNIFVVQNGDVLSMSPGKYRITGRVQSGAILVDGMAMGEFEGSLLQERRALSEDGIIVMSVSLNSSGKLMSPVRVESRGFMHPQAAKGLYAEIEAAASGAVESYSGKMDAEVIATGIRKKVRDVLSRYGRTYPTLVPLVSFTDNL